MKAELITVGTEILMGQIVNTNGTFLSRELNQLGFDLYFETVVGDNAPRLEQILKTAKSRSDLVVLTGGLGPTLDDLTKQTVATFLGVSLVEDEKAIVKIENYIKKAHLTFTENNRLQALYLKGGESLPNATGLAVGSLIEKDGTTYVLLPGPPSELKPMFKDEVIPRVQKLFPHAAHLYSETLRFYNIGESQLVTKLDDLIKNQTNPTLAPYAKENEVTLRITAQEKDPVKGQKKVEEKKQEVLALVKDYYYASGEENSLVQALVTKLEAEKKTISAAESYTAGLFQSSLGSISGVSKVFSGGVVTYATEEKVTLLGVKESTIQQYGVVSSEVACEMAENVREKIGTDIAVSFTGSAGPEPVDNHAPGEVYIGIAKEGQLTKAYFYQFQGDRNHVRRHSVKEACWLLLKETEK